MEDYFFAGSTNFSYEYGFTNFTYGSCSADQTVEFCTRIILGSIAFFGNLSFMFVVCRVKSTRTIPNLHFINLSVADMMMIITELGYDIIQQLTVAGHLPFEDNLILFTKIIPKIWIFVTPTYLCIALLTITLISIERYVVVSHPFKANASSLRSKKRVLSFMALTWVTGISLGSFALYTFYVRPNDDDLLLAWCIIFTLFTVLPVCFVIVSYTLLMATIAMLKRPVNHTRNKKKKKRRQSSVVTTEESHVLILCGAITILFFLCFTPLAVSQLIETYSKILPQSPISESTTACLKAIQTYALLIHLALSPILYNLGSRSRRRAFRKAFSSSCEESGTHDRYVHYEGIMNELHCYNDRRSSVRGSARFSE
ncbi:kappa-type opioid receptor-like [Glandiceps talaboti]